MWGRGHVSMENSPKQPTFIDLASPHPHAPIATPTTPTSFIQFVPVINPGPVLSSELLRLISPTAGILGGFPERTLS